MNLDFFQLASPSLYVDNNSLTQNRRNDNLNFTVS